MAKPDTKKSLLIGVTTVGEKGQIVIPADMRAAFKLSKGVRLMMVAHGKGIFLMRPVDVERMTNRFGALKTFMQKSI